MGWELTLAGTGRPQALINEEVRACDYMVLVLWDRWGSPPATEGPYTSGTEEEYAVARECLAAAASPMRDIVVLFKGVDTRQLSDPGDQLRKVLAFKRTLEEQKTLLYGTFDSEQGFERDLRRHLLRWMRDAGEGDKSGTRPEAPAPPSDTPEQAATLFEPPASVDADDSTQLLAMADDMADQGRLAEAESLYAKAVVARTDVAAMTKYTRFLRRTGRTDLALAMSERLLEVSRQLEDPRSEIEALSNIAIMRRNDGHLEDAVALLTEGVAVAVRLGADGAKDLAFLYDNIGLTQRRQGNIAGALASYDQALGVREKVDDEKGFASTLNNIAVLMRQTGDTAAAEKNHQRAFAIFDKLAYRRGLAITRGYLGEVYEAQGRIDEAEVEYRQALELDQALKSPRGTSINLCQLGRIALLRDDISAAIDYAEDALASGEEFGNREGIAGALHLFARIQIHDDEYVAARINAQSALEIYRELDHQLAVAWTLSDLALINARLGAFAESRAALRSALDAAGRLLHAPLSAHLEGVQAEIDTLDPTDS
jgi:tetratricopeptide (TPR) repeat protein